MAASQKTSTDHIFVDQITKVYSKMKELHSLKPSKEVNSVMGELVSLCTTYRSIDLKSQPKDVQAMCDCIVLIGANAEALLELEFSQLLSKTPNPILSNYHYYDDYRSLCEQEYTVLDKNGMGEPGRVAFVGSGPMPMSSIIMCERHMTYAHFDNLDIDAKANEAAENLIISLNNTELKRRMRFKTCDIMSVTEKLEEYDCVFLAALAGINRDQKIKILNHLNTYMKKGGFLVVRSTTGGSVFMYPAVEEQDLLKSGFKVLGVVNTEGSVINSVFLVQKP